MLQECVEIMSAFEEATQRVQGEKIVTSSLVIPCIIALKAHLNSQDWKHDAELADSLKIEMNRLRCYEEQAHLQRATLLDPRLKRRCFNEENTFPHRNSTSTNTCYSPTSRNFNSSTSKENQINLFLL